MSLLSFIQEAGEKLFGHKQAQSDDAAAAIRDYVERQSLGIRDLAVAFDAATGTATVAGDAPSQEAREKAALCCGNVAGVRSVQNQLTVQVEAAEASFHDVVAGETLSAIAKQHYGDATRYMVIFEANRPMLAHPDRIYPGQKLRIPPR